MKDAADALVRGLSHHYEGPNQEVPSNVVKALEAMSAHVDKATDIYSQCEAYRAGLVLLGNAMGDACVAKAREGN